MPAETALQLGQFQDNFDYSGYSGDFGLHAYNTRDEVNENYGNEFITSGSSLPERVLDLLGLSDYKARYDNYLKERERQYERASINSARAWEEYLDSTKYQRAVADLKKAGLNPWLAVQSGGVSGSAQGSSTSTGGSSGKSQNRDDNRSVIAALITACARLLVDGL